MGISTELVKIIIVLLPGIVSMLVIEKLITHKNIEFNRFSVYSVALSITIYLLSYIFSLTANSLVGIFGYEIHKEYRIFFLPLLLKNLGDIPPKVAMYVILVGIVLGVILSIVINKKIINRVAHKLNITHKYGDESVWEYFHNKSSNVWVFVRDQKNDLLYYGWIEVFSDDGNGCDELVMRNVDVYKNSTGEKFYSIDEVYISGKREDLRIEIRAESLESDSVA